MTLDQLINELNLIKAHAKSGEMPVYWQSISNLNDPDLLVKKTVKGKDYLILNS